MFWNCCTLYCFVLLVKYHICTIVNFCTISLLHFNDGGKAVMILIYRTSLPQLRLVALNQPLSGDLGGVAGADYQCYQQSFKSGATGIYRAFLSDKMQNVKNIIADKYFNLPVVNLKVNCFYTTLYYIFGRGHYILSIVFDTWRPIVFVANIHCQKYKLQPLGRHRPATSRSK